MKSHKIILIIFLSIIILINGSAIKFKTKTDDGKDLIFQAIFDTGFSAEAASDAAGISDYETVFFRPAFHVQDFGIGLDFDFRFRLFVGEFEFLKTDWFRENDPLATVFLYLDKIDYIVYGIQNNTPIFLHVGKNPVTTLGSGLVVNNFHNHAFLPTSKEQGFFFQFDGNFLDKYSTNNMPVKNIPIYLTFLINDLLDPDIYALDLGFDAMKLTKFKDTMSFKTGITSTIDINSTESNRLSSLSSDTNLITSHRNMDKSTNFTSIPLFMSLYNTFNRNNKYIGLNFFDEIAFLFDMARQDTLFQFGFGLKIGTEIKFINIDKSGYLLGITAGYLLESPNFLVDYFSYNYEVVRQKQYSRLAQKADYVNYILAGIGFYGFDERLQFKLTMTMPLVSRFAAKISSQFILQDTLVKGLYLSVYYETGVNTMYAEGNGGGIIDSLTRDFRFATEFGYKFYGAKLSIVLGIQRAAYVVPGLIANSGTTNNPYYELANGRTVPTQIEDASYNWNMNTDQYGLDLQKFISMEISFVF